MEIKIIDYTFSKDIDNVEVLKLVYENFQQSMNISVIHSAWTTFVY